LNALAEAAYDDGGAEARVRGHLGEGFFGLDGELAGWAQNYGANAGGWVLDQRFEQWEDKGKSLAGSGLRRGDDIVAGERGRDCLGLDGGRLHKIVPREVGLQNRGQRDFRKCMHSKVCEGDQRVKNVRINFDVDMSIAQNRHA
jgi:hypothetical protein